MENKIRRARKKKGYTQEELACMVGCSVKTIIRWEKGENRVSSQYFKKLSENLDLNMEDFLSEYTNKRRKKLLFKRL